MWEGIALQSAAPSLTGLHGHVARERRLMRTFPAHARITSAALATSYCRESGQDAWQVLKSSAILPGASRLSSPYGTQHNAAATGSSLACNSLLAQCSFFCQSATPHHPELGTSLPESCRRPEQPTLQLSVPYRHARRSTVLLPHVALCLPGAATSSSAASSTQQP